MDPALDHQSRPQPMAIMRMLVASRALQAPSLGAVTQPAQQLSLTLASALRAEPEGAGLDNRAGGQLGTVQNEVGCGSPSQRLPSHHDALRRPWRLTSTDRRWADRAALVADRPPCRDQTAVKQLSAASRICQVT